MKREKSTWQERIFAEHIDGLKSSDICDFEKPRKCANRKGMIESNEHSKEMVSQNKFVKKGRGPDRVESFGKVDSGKNRPRPGLGFLSPSEMDREIKNLIKSRPSIAETGLVGRENDGRF